ncbi:MAG: DUF2141 domain-containing protein [Pseudomonadota bacterium]
MTHPACRLAPLFALTTALSSAPATSEEITILVSGIEADRGEIGCALYGSADGFPLEPSVATSQWHAAKQEGVECRFTDITPGDYAVAVSHDFNGNQETDTNFLGIPKEPWGVSNNIRPTLRAPRFEEAAVDLSPGESLRIEVEVQ